MVCYLYWEGLVSKILSGIELFFGFRRDEIFGTRVVFGLGGILAEIIGDVAMKLCPSLSRDIEDVISETRTGRLMNGNRRVISSLIFSNTTLTLIRIFI